MEQPTTVAPFFDKHHVFSNIVMTLTIAIAVLGGLAVGAGILGVVWILAKLFLMFIPSALLAAVIKGKNPTLSRQIFANGTGACVLLLASLYFVGSY